MKLSRMVVPAFCLAVLLAACTSNTAQTPGNAAAESSPAPESPSSADTAEAEKDMPEIDKEDASRVVNEFCNSYSDLTGNRASDNNTLDFSNLTDLEREEFLSCAPDSIGTYAVITCNDDGNTTNILMFFCMEGSTERIRIVSRYNSAEECEAAVRVMYPMFSEQITESDIDALGKDSFFSGNLSKKTFTGTDVGVKKLINVVCWADAPRDALAFIE